MINLAIDLTWLKVGKTGGAESYIRNLLDGLLEIKDPNFNFILLTSKDNALSFEHYNDYFNKHVCNINSNDVLNHLIWQNLFQNKLLKKLKIDLCFFPVYEMPIFKNKKIKTVCTIHDLQAIHYPEYFNILENLWFRFAWQRVIDISNYVVAISDFTKNDIINNLRNVKNIIKIYNPIELNNDCRQTNIMERYNIKKNNYFYTVCSLYKHKNLMTILKMMTLEKIDEKQLVISGVTGPQKKDIEDFIKENNLESKIIITNFVSNAERNELIRNAYCFIFPSIFEGFGMPPVEAMMLGAPVVTTKLTSIPEVTKNACYYVDNPLTPEDWLEKIQNIENSSSKIPDFDCYNKVNIAKEYLNLFSKIYYEK